MPSAGAPGRGPAATILPARPLMVATSEPAPAYWEVEVELPPAAEELWSLFVHDQGASGAEWVEEQPQRLRIRYYFDRLDAEAVRGWPRRFLEQYPAATAPFGLRVARKVRQRWELAWRAHFAPLPVGRGWLVRPPWAEEKAPSRAGRLPLVIEPGQGFGTGRHATTALMLELLEDLADAGPLPSPVLDVGTGSGILAIAAARLGAAAAWGLDLERAALLEARRNFRLNGVAGRLHLARGGPDCLRGSFPLVLANLTAPVLRRARHDLAARVAPGGTLLLSGLVSRDREDLVLAYAARGFGLRRTRRREDWAALHLERER